MLGMRTVHYSKPHLKYTNAQFIWNREWELDEIALILPPRPHMPLNLILRSEPEAN